MSHNLELRRIKLEISKTLSQSLKSFTIWKGLDSINQDFGDVDVFLDPSEIDSAIRLIDDFFISRKIDTKSVKCGHIAGLVIYCIAIGNTFLEFDLTTSTTTLGGNKGMNWNDICATRIIREDGLAVANPRISAVTKFCYTYDFNMLKFEGAESIIIDNESMKLDLFKKLIFSGSPKGAKTFTYWSCTRMSHSFRKFNSIILRFYIKSLILFNPKQLIVRLRARYYERYCFVIVSITKYQRSLKILEAPPKMTLKNHKLVTLNKKISI